MNPPSKPTTRTPPASEAQLTSAARSASPAQTPSTPAKSPAGSPAPGQESNWQTTPPPYTARSPSSGPGGQQPPIQTQQPTTNVLLPVIPPAGVMSTGAPTVMQCPSCRAQMVTHVQHEHGSCVYLGMGLCCLFGCWLGCCLLPLWMPDLQDATHFCSNCKRIVGVYKRL